MIMHKFGGSNVREFVPVVNVYKKSGWTRLSIACSIIFAAWNAVGARDVLRSGCEFSYPPFCFVDEQAMRLLSSGKHDAVVAQLLMGIIIPIVLIAIIAFIALLRKKVKTKTKEVGQAYKRWERTFEAVPDLIAIIDSDHKILQVNRAMAEALHAKKSDIIGKPCYELMHGTDGPIKRCPHQWTLRDQQGHTVEIDEKHLNGHFRVSTVPLKDEQGTIEGCVHIARDITDNIQREAILEEKVKARTASLKEAERKYRIVADFTADWEYWEAPNGQLRFVSPSCETITGYTPDAFIAHPALMTQIIVKEDRDLWQNHEALPREEKTNDSICFRIRTRSGAIKWIEHACHPVQEGDKNLGFRGSNRDVTEREEAESERDMLREEAAHMMRVSALGELTCALAHEINQPLGAILCNSQVAQRVLKRKPVDIEELQELLGDIVSDDQRAGDVVRRLRTMVSAEQTAHETININVLIREVLYLLKSELIIDRITITAELAESLPPVKCDPIQLQQVILNLITNSIDALRECARDTRIMTVRSERTEAGEVCMTVRDQGDASNITEVEQLFEAFYTTKKKGMGVGLAISRRIIENHNGRLWGEKNKNGGLTMSFALPEADTA